jgi:hypothetical protein
MLIFLISKKKKKEIKLCKFNKIFCINKKTKFNKYQNKAIIIIKDNSK